MGIGIGMSSNSRDNRNYPIETEYKIPEQKIVRVNSTPDPTNFRILKQICINGYWIFEVNYPGVKNYEGNKILMYPKHFNIDVLFNRMDPHFFTDGDSPIARFEPTKYGWSCAETLALNLP